MRCAHSGPLWLNKENTTPARLFGAGGKARRLFPPLSDLARGIPRLYAPNE